MIITGSQIKKLRTDAGFTQRQLAQLVGVSQAHIAKIENSKVDPRLSTINKILQVLTEGKGQKCEEIMTPDVIFAKPNDKIKKICGIMLKKAISQLPVTQGGKIIGTITEERIMKNLHNNIGNEIVDKIMDTPLPFIQKDVNVSMIRQLLEDYPGVLVIKKGKVLGIVTRSDLLKTVS